MILNETYVGLTPCRRQSVELQSVETPEQKQGMQPFGVIGFK